MEGAGDRGLVRAQLAHFADLSGRRIAAHDPKALESGFRAAIGLALLPMLGNMGRC
jgi:hypothetical protein